MGQEEETSTSPRLVKEAKIGVAVILLLLVVFVTAVVVRLSGSPYADDTLASERVWEVSPLPDRLAVPGEGTINAGFPNTLSTADRDVRLVLHDEELPSRAPSDGVRRSGRTYTVAEGDSLFDIARQELGKASRWVEIYELNRDLLGKDFNRLLPGVQLTLPEDEKPDVPAQPPGDAYRK